MPMVLTDQGPIFFVHVPKTGGTSMEHYLSQRFGPLALTDVNKRDGVPGTSLLCALNHVSAVDLKEMIPAETKFLFAIVRHPLNRLLSEYRWQRGASRTSRMDFSTWLRTVVSAYRLENRVYGNHIRPQSDLVPEDAEVFKLEDGFDPVIKRLDQLFGEEPPGLEVGRFKNRAEHSGDVKIHRQDAELVGELYRADFERFGYDASAPASYSSDPYAAFRSVVAHPMAMALVAKQRRDWLR